MSNKSSAQNIIRSYRKRQQMGPFLIGGLAVLLAVVGILVLVIWLTGPNRPAFAFLGPRTPTPTATFTPPPPTSTPTASLTPTASNTPTATATFTPSGPFQYQVQEGDTCFDLAEKFKVDLLVLLAINNFNDPKNPCPIKVGDTIYIPGPDTQLPTATAIPTNFRGDITYVVQAGDNLFLIAARFNSTVDSIRAKNKLKSDNITVGQTLIIAVNIATPVPTKAPTSTPAPNLFFTPTLPFTTTPSATSTVTPSP